MKIAEVIKWDAPGSNNILIHKFESEDFNTLSQLIVHEWQEAILFKDGQALDTFGPGRYTLHTKNIPLIGRLIRLPLGGVSPFHCEVYFVNKRVEHMGMLWGVGNIPVDESGYPFKIGARGDMSLSVINSRKILEKLLGSDEELTERMVQDKFKHQIEMRIRETISKEINQLGISIFELEQHMTSIAGQAAELLSPVIDAYGFSLNGFSIAGFLRPESSAEYQRLLKLRANESLVQREKDVDNRAMLEAKKAEIEAKRMDIDLRAYEASQLNYSKSHERMYDILQSLAENQGSGSDVRNDLLGLGVGLGVTAPVSGLFHSVVEGAMNPSMVQANPSKAEPAPAQAPAPVPSSEMIICPECGKLTRADKTFCSKCGADFPVPLQCKRCGAQMETDDIRCPECGAKKEGD